MQSTRAERQADGGLALPARVANEQQARHVRHRDQQQHARSPLQHPQKRTRVADVEVTKRTDGDRETFVRVWMLARQPLGDGAQLDLGALAAHTVAQTSNDAIGTLFTIGQRGARQLHWCPHLRVGVGMRKRWRHHADDGVRAAVELDAVADNRRPGVEPPPPQVIAQHDDGVSSRLPLVGQEGPAEPLVECRAARTVLP